MKTGSEIGIGIVGCGAIAQIHAKVIKKLAGARLVSVYSRNPENARSLGELYGATFTDKWDTFIQNADMQVVSICTPSGTHLDYAKLTADAGKHLIVEKPLEVTIERGRKLIAACRKNGVSLSVIFQNRYLPDLKELKRRLDSGALGQLHLADAYIKWFRTQEYYDSAAWRGTLELDGGGVLINQAIHTIDLLQWLAGEVKTVFAQTGTFTHKSIEGEDTAAAVLRFMNGGLGVIEGATSVLPAMERRLELHGAKGTAILSGDHLTVWDEGEGNRIAADIARRKSAGASSPLDGFPLEPHLEQFRDIIESIKSGREAPVSGEEALKSLAIVKAIYQSAATRRPVEIESILNKKMRNQNNDH